MHIIQGVLAVLARIMLSGIFLMSAIAKDIPEFNGVADSMKAHNMPQPKLMLIGAIVFLILGGLSLLLGYKARLGSLMLIIFLGMAAFFFHDFWNYEGIQAQKQMQEFMKNVALAGGLLFILANGAGAASLDRCLSKDK